MPTKKGSKKSGGGKTGAANKSTARKSSAKAGKKKQGKKRKLNGLPPVILGGGGSIVIYSDQKLEEPKPADSIPSMPGYPYMLVYPDRTKDPVHVNHLRNGKGVPFHKHKLKKETDVIVIETE